MSELAPIRFFLKEVFTINSEELATLITKAIEKKKAWIEDGHKIEAATTVDSTKKSTIVTITPSLHSSVNEHHKQITGTYVEAKHKVTNRLFNNLRSSAHKNDTPSGATLVNTSFTAPIETPRPTNVVQRGPVCYIETGATAGNLVKPKSAIILFGNYEWDTSRQALYYQKSSDKRSEIANFTISIQRIVEVRENLCGQGEYLYEILISHAQGQLPQKITEKKYKSVLGKIGETINPIFNIVNKSLYERYLSDVVSQYWAQGGTVTLELAIYGWICSPENHVYQYAFNNTCINLNRTQLRVVNGIQNEQSHDRSKIFFDSYLRISKNVNLLMSALLYTLHTHIALPYKTITGQRLQSGMVFLGETQHGKSVLADLLSKGLQNKCHADYFYKYDGTNASINHILGRHGQGLYVFDDIYRKANADESRSDEDKLNTIARILGDGVIASKMKRFGDGLEESKSFDGGVIITAELLPVENESTQGRLIINKFDATSRIDFENNQDLTFLQSNPQLLDAFLSSWVAYMEETFQHDLDNLKNRHQLVYQALKKQNLHTRLCAYGALILNTLHYLVQFSTTIGSPIDFTSVKNYLLVTLQMQHQEYQRHADADALQEQIADAINCADLSLAPNQESYASNFDGFIDEKGYYCIVIPRLEEVLVRQGYNKNDCNAMYDKLINKGVMISKSRSMYRISKGNTRPYYFKFAPSIIDIEEHYDTNALYISNDIFTEKGF